MKLDDIKTVALGLHEGRPKSYPNGGPDTEDGWKAWRATVYSVQLAIAQTTRSSLWQRMYEKVAEDGKE